MSRNDPKETPYWERWATADQVGASIGGAFGTKVSACDETLEAYVKAGTLRKRKNAEGKWEYAPVPPPGEEPSGEAN